MDPLVEAIGAVSSEKLDLPGFHEPDIADDNARLDDDDIGRGSGIRIESSTAAPPSRAASAEQVLLSTLTGFACCQHRPVTA